jgi:hypothetical protein
VPVDHGGHEGLDLLGVPDVGRVERHAGGQAVGLLAAADGDRRPAVDEALGDAAADAPRAARDQGHEALDPAGALHGCGG